MTLHSPNSFLRIPSTLPSVLKNLDSREVTSAHLCVHVKSSVVLRGGSESPRILEMYILLLFRLLSRVWLFVTLRDCTLLLCSQDFLGENLGG